MRARGSEAGGCQHLLQRRKGTPNKVTVEVRAACAAIVDDPVYRQNLLERARNGKLAPAVETILWFYAKGKPKDEVDVTVQTDVSKLSDTELFERFEAVRARLFGMMAAGRVPSLLPE